MKSDKLAAMTKLDLLAMARKMDISGRSQMSKDQLVRAIGRESAPSKKKTKTRASGGKRKEKSVTASKPPVRRRKVEAEPTEERPTAQTKPAPTKPKAESAPRGRETDRRPPREPRPLQPGGP